MAGADVGPAESSGIDDQQLTVSVWKHGLTPQSNSQVEEGQVHKSYASCREVPLSGCTILRTAKGCCCSHYSPLRCGGGGFTLLVGVCFAHLMMADELLRQQRVLTATCDTHVAAISRHVRIPAHVTSLRERHLFYNMSIHLPWWRRWWLLLRPQFAAAIVCVGALQFVCSLSWLRCT